MAQRTVFLYDGDCGFCHACANFLKRRVAAAAIVRPWQECDLDGLGVSAEQCESAVQWVSPGEPVVAGPDAIAKLLTGAGRTKPWKTVGAVLSLRPVRRPAWAVYRWVARNRYRMPGGTTACALPPHEARSTR